MSTSERKQLASIHMLDAMIEAQVAYYSDPTPTNLNAVQACRTAVREMLRPYYLTTGESNGKD